MNLPLKWHQSIQEILVLYPVLEYQKEPTMWPVSLLALQKPSSVDRRGRRPNLVSGSKPP
jgi:hypothetical protein